MARQPLFLHTADWHCRKLDRVWSRRPGLWGDTTFAIRQIVEIVRQRKIPYLLLLGDVFEEKLQPSDSLYAMRQAMDDLQAMGCRVYYIQGQHEKSHPPLLHALHQWPTYIHGKTIPVGDHQIYGLDYQNPTAVEDALRGIPGDPTILATHQVWKEYMGMKRGYASMSWIPGSVELLLTGDYHQHRTDMFGRLRVYSPGSICVQDVGEEPDKRVYLFYDDLSAESIPLKGRLIYQDRVDTEEQLDEFLAHWLDHPYRLPQPGVPAEIATPILRLGYMTTIPEARRRLEAALGAQVHLFLDPIAPPRPSYQPGVQERAAVVRQGGMEGVLAADESLSPQLRQLALRLWAAEDTQAEINAITQELMEVDLDAEV